MLPLKPWMTALIERVLSAIRKSDFASGGKAPGTPRPGLVVELDSSV